MLQSTQLRPGMVIIFNGELHTVFSMTHRTPGNLRGFVQAKCATCARARCLNTASLRKIESNAAVLEELEMEYMYDDGEYYYFMNTENFEQTHLTKETLGDGVSYLIPNLKVNVEYYEGKPVSVELPPGVVMKVVEVEPGIKGGSVSNVGKPAKMETGLIVSVPQFVNEGDSIRVSTSDGSYQERVTV